MSIYRSGPAITRQLHGDKTGQRPNPGAEVKVKKLHGHVEHLCGKTGDATQLEILPGLLYP